MDAIYLKIQQLKEKLESAAFLVGQPGSAKEVHNELIKSLILLSEIETVHSSSPSTSAPQSTENEASEVNKVRRRLKLWSARPHQINSKILTAYLKLKREGNEVVTEEMLKNELPEENSFDSNFAQMKIIADRNHGKVFDQHGNRISIWGPIKADVEEYERLVFGS